MIQKRTWLAAALCAAAGLLLFVPASRAQGRECEAYAPIERFATPNAFSKKPAQTLEELQALFQQLRPDIETVLREAGWRGDPQTLFQAVAQGRVEETRLGKGERFRWMGFRKDGDPEVKRCVAWQGMKTVEAWKVEVASNGTYSTFYVPKVCLNISLFREEPLREPPVCKLRVSRDCGSRSFTVDTSGSSDDVRVEVEAPNRRVSRLGSSRDLSYDHEYGTYRFTASADRGTNRLGEALRCQELVEIETCPEQLSCELSISVSEITAREPYTVAVSVSGPVAQPRIEGVSLEVESDRGTSQRDLSPPYSITETQDKAGVYTYRATAQGGTEGPASCDGSIQVKPSRPLLTLRLFGGRLDATGGEVFQDLSAVGGATTVAAQQTVDRRKYDAGGGDGFGLSLEYHLKEWLGVEVAAVRGTSEITFVFDTDRDWELDKDDLSLTLLTAGVNFHLTPGRKVDVFVGPFLGKIDYGDVNLRALGRNFDHDFDNDEAVGLNLGIGVPTCGKRCWLFYGGLRYLETTAELDQAPGLDLSVDPFFVTVGAAFNF